MPNKSSKDEELSFENAIERLEVLVDALETGDIPLAELIEKYEDGTNLFKYCNRKLTNAERKIEQLRMDDATDTEALPGDESDS